MKKHIFIIINLILAIILFINVNYLSAQTTYLSGSTGDGDFEAGGGTWTIVNGAQTNKWYVGTKLRCNGSAAWASNGSNSTSYTHTSSTVHIYKSITFTSGESIISLSFDLKGGGESTWDGVKVYVTSSTPVAGTSISSADQVGNTWYNLQGSCTTYNITIPASHAGTTKNLVFSWINDGSGGDGSSDCIDNIVLTSAPPCWPSTQATSFTSSSITSTTMTIGWTRGNGNNVMVIAKAGSAPTDPTSGTTYTANAAYGSGTAVGGGFCVYNGTGTSVNLTALTAGTTYYFAIYEYNTTGTCYNLTELTGNATTCPTVVTLPQTCDFTSFTGSNLTTLFPNFSEATGATPTGTTSAWTSSTVFTSTTAKINLYTSTRQEWIIGPTFLATATSALTFKAAITDFGSGSADPSGMQGTDDKVIIRVKPCGGTWTDVYTFQASNTTTLTNILTDYLIDLSSYSGQNITVAFYASDGPTDNSPDYDFHIEDINILNSCSFPSTQATTFTSSSISTTTMTIGWTRGNGNNVMVIAKAGSAPTDPSSGTSYTANAAYGSGTAVGGGYCVYNGTGTSVNLTGLNSSTTYYFAIYEYNNSGNCYNLVELAGNATTLDCWPSTQATTFSSSSITTTTMTVGWTRGNGNNVMVIARAGSAPTDPSSGTSYTADAAYGSGTAVGGGFCVYNGTGTSVNLTALTAGTTYYFAIYEYNTTGTCYNLIQLTGNATTSAGALNGTFSGGTTFGANGMFAVNGATNYWIVGTATHNGAPNSAYITNNGSANAYTNTTSQVSHFYFDYDFPAGQSDITLSFDWKSNGESCCDHLKTYIVATTTTPSSGIELSSTYQVGTTYNAVTTWQNASLTLDPSFAGTTQRIVFSWTNDGSVGTNPPAAVDNIVISTAIPCWPSTQATSFTSSSITSTTMTVGWTRGNGNNVMVIAKAGSAPTDPTSGTTYTANAAYGSGTAVGGGFCVYNGSGTSVNLTALSASTTYYFAIYEYNTTGTCYNLTELTGNATTTVGAFNGAFSGGTSFGANGMYAVNGGTNYWIVGTATHNGAPNSAYITNDGTANAYSTGTSQVSHFYFDYAFPAGQSDITLSFDWKSNGESCCDHLKTYIVATTTTPSSGIELSSTYQVGTTYNAVTTWQNASLTLDPSFAGTTQRIVFSWTNDGSVGTNPPAAVDNIIISTAIPCWPSTQATSFTSSSITSTTMTVGWTRGNGNNVMVIAKAGSAPTDPTSGTTYTANAAYGSGTAVGGGFCVYNGPGTSVNITGLSGSTTYYFAIYEYNTTGTCYNLTQLTGNATTCPSAVSIPQTCDFTSFTGANLTTVFPNFSEATGATPSGTTSSWTNSTVLGSQTTARINLYSTGKAEWIIGPTFVVSNNALLFKAAITEFSSGSTDPSGMQGTDDKVIVRVKPCGGAWSDIYTLQAANTISLSNTLTQYSIDLSSFNGQTITVAFFASEGTIDDSPDYDFHLDDINIVAPCSGAPTAGTATSSISNFCNTGTPTLTLTGYTLAGGITFQWEESTVGPPYSWSPITGAQSTMFTVSPAINLTTYYRCAVTCGSNTSYSNVLTVTNVAQQITSTNSPVTVTCNTSASMTATTSGGTINWYAASSGGTALGTGSPFNQTVTANTTYYCTANASGSTAHIGQTSWNAGDGYYGGTNTGLVFDAISAFTLISVNVYVQTAGSNVKIQFQDNTGSPIQNFSFNNCPAGLNTLTLNLSVPVGTGYRLVSNNSISLGRGSTGVSFPYTVAGTCSITNGYFLGSSSTYYFFYDWIISTGCESSPRTPVNVIVSGGVTAPVCSGTPTPTDAATGICPIGLALSWGASTTACRTATGYKLFLGTNAAATNIYNGIDIGLVTTYSLPTLVGSTLHYWKIVPYNTAGDATGCSTWTFTTAANPGSLCATNLGTGVYNVATLPYNSGAGTTQGKVNDVTAANAVTCGSSSYFGGEDEVWIFTPTTSGSITISLSSSGSWTGLTLYEGCPLVGTICGAIQGNCIGYTQSSSGTKSMTVCVTAGITYYLILDSYPSPDYNSYTDLSISAPSGYVATNDLPCNAIPLTLGLNTGGNNACTGGAAEPSTPTCWTYGVLNTVWFSAVCPASGKLSFLTTLGTLTNTQIAVYTGSCAALTYVSSSCNDDISGCGSSEASKIELTGLTPGATYYVRIDGAYDLIGDFSILAIDGNSSFPTTPGQDCASSLPSCNESLNVGDPGYNGTGSVCDFDGTYDCTGGDRAAVFYTIEIANAGQLMFNIVPNDYSGGYPGDGTDYDFIIWKIAGSGTLATCSSIATNSSIGMVACNYSYIDVTGLYTGGNAPAPYGSGFDGAYEPPITVAAGDVYLLWISNYSLSTSGFTISFSNSTPSATSVINFAPTPTLINWSGSTSTAWNLSDNWGGCNIPSCSVSATVNSLATNQPKITTNGTVVKDLTILPGATLTIGTAAQPRKLQICGNLINNGTIILNGTSTLEFIGTSAQTFANSGNITVPNLIINNTSGGITLAGGGDVTITNTLTLTSGQLTTSNSSMLILDAGGTVSGGSSTSFINGPLQKIGNTAFTFPIGKSSKYARLGIAASTAPTNNFQAEYYKTGSPNNTLTNMGTGVDHVSYLEYWTIDKLVGSEYPAVTLYWDDATFSIIDITGNSYANIGDLIVAHWNTSTSKWDDMGGTATTVGPYVSGYITSTVPFTSYSPVSFGSKTAKNPLPVNLLIFRGKNENHLNFLDWSTSSEINNNFFSLERSIDGSTFEVIGIIKGSGNSNSEKNYQFIDTKPYVGYNYYRLKQTDFDGTYKYSEIIAIRNVLDIQKPEFIKLYPNPSSSIINLSLFTPDEDDVLIEIFDMYGRLIFQEKTSVSKGNGVVTKDISYLASGVYATKITFINHKYSCYKQFIKK